MKKTTLMIALIGSMTASLTAESAKEITYAENINPSTKERTFYNKGFKDGKEIGMREGYDKARKDMLKILRRYASKIKAYEAGKYLSKKGKVTPPRVYQKRSGSRVEVVVKGCEIRGVLKPSDLLKLPEYEGGDTDAVYTSTTPATDNPSDPQMSDGVFLNGIDSNTHIAKPTQSLKQTNTIVLPDTKFYRDLLRTSGTLFSIQNGGGGLRAVFKNAREKNSFIQNFGLEYGKDYR